MNIVMFSFENYSNARQHTDARYWYRKSVCPSVCPSVRS